MYGQIAPQSPVNPAENLMMIIPIIVLMESVMNISFFLICNFLIIHWFKNKGLNILKSKVIFKISDGLIKIDWVMGMLYVWHDYKILKECVDY